MKENINLPIYMQVANLIENQILSGDLTVNDNSPSTNDFAKMYDINPATARKGLNILIDEGILYKKRGLGMFVKEGAREVILEKRRNDYFNNMLPKLIEEGKRLEISRNKIIDKIRGGDQNPKSR